MTQFCFQKFLDFLIVKQYCFAGLFFLGLLMQRINEEISYTTVKEFLRMIDESEEIQIWLHFFFNFAKNRK